jgi:predicted nucleotidyltransferase
MRLSPEQTHIILTMVSEQVGTDARVVLYGSRTDDTRRGGDIDLLIESPCPPNLKQRARLKLALEDALRLPVDIIAKATSAAATPFQAIALDNGIPIAETP